MTEIDAQLSGQPDDPLLPTLEPDEQETRASLLKLMVGAVGVVYGDIGTSPLYTMRECFGRGLGVPLSPANVLGLVSLVIWSLLVVVTLKYVVFILRADNRGEGGILALMTLARRGLPFSAAAVTLLGLAGAALFYGDAIITPAISVLSAVEGLEIVTPALEPVVIPVALAILIGLFVVQRLGTGRVGAFFGPVMIAWFTTLAVLGLAQIAQYPTVLQAFDPSHAVRFFAANGFIGFAALGAVVLAITGGEALYADMGHFGRQPLRLSWFGFVLPALVINYLGQAALVLQTPDAVENPFFRLAPEWLLLPLLLLATLATIIASQAVISGAFSLTRQAVQLGLFPRTVIQHTSAEQFGQIYLPVINWALLAGVILLVLLFQTSSDLAAAYGIAVTGTMALTTILAFNVVAGCWKWGVWVAAAIVTVFLAVDLGFFTANLLKVFEGGWMPLVVGALVYLLMDTWRAGRRLVATRRGEGQRLGTFLRRLREAKPARVPGTAIYLTSQPGLVPQSLELNLKHNKVLHERIVLLSFETVPEPRLPRRERVSLREIIPNVLQVEGRGGFMQEPNILRILGECRRLGLQIDPRTASFFIGRIVPVPTSLPGMAIWREWLFVVIARNATSAADFFSLPPDRTIEVGERIAI